MVDDITDSMDMSLSELQELVMPSSHLILWSPLLLLPPIPSSIRGGLVCWDSCGCKVSDMTELTELNTQVGIILPIEKLII